MASQGKILIADDEEPFLRVTADILRREGYDCVCVPDGAAARQKLIEETFDLLICDINMPGNADLELIRDLPAAVHGIPVILLTGNPSMDTAIESVHLSVMAYLVKPVQKKELLQWVERLVEYSRVCRSGNEVSERLNGWMIEIGRMREYLAQNSHNTQHVPVGNFISLTIANMLGSILDLKGLVEGMSGRQSEREVCRLYDCPRLEAQRKIIEETIQVLEKTKHAFKSKELSEHRQRLEKFLHGPE